MQSRRSNRKVTVRRSYSPDSCEATVPKKPKPTTVSRRKQKQYDIDPATGKKFECEQCRSNYIIDPSRKKKHSKRYKPSPRCKPDPNTGRVLILCNSCGLKFERRANGTAEKSGGLTAQEKRIYEQQSTQFICNIKQLFNTHEVEKLVCRNVGWKICGCIQAFILGTHNSLEVEAQNRIQLLLCILREAQKLSQLKYHDISSVSDNHSKCERVGLGNGRKKSVLFHEYVLKQREYLRKDCGFCEKATQQILGYSNNLLYRKLKTEENKSRVEVKIGKGAKDLIDIESLSDQSCCDNNCVVIARDSPVLVTEWRERALLGQMDAKIVIGEMLTPAAGVHFNCVQFIAMVTGCCLSTISKMAQQIKTTGGDRQPPEHGLKKYHLLQQTQENYAIETPTVTSPQQSVTPCAFSDAHVIGRMIDVQQVSPEVELTGDKRPVLYHNQNTSDMYSNVTGHVPQVTDGSQIAHAGDVVSHQTTPNVTIQSSDILTTLEFAREKVLKLQKNLEKKQHTLKSKQQEIERQMLVAVHVKAVANKRKKNVRQISNRAVVKNSHTIDHTVKNNIEAIERRVRNNSVASNQPVMDNVMTSDKAGRGNATGMNETVRNSYIFTDNNVPNVTVMSRKSVVEKETEVSHGIVPDRTLADNSCSSQRDGLNTTRMMPSGVDSVVTYSQDHTSGIQVTPISLSGDANLQLLGNIAIYPSNDMLSTVPLYTPEEVTVGDNVCVLSTEIVEVYDLANAGSNTVMDPEMQQFMGTNAIEDRSHVGTENRQILSSNDVFLSSALTDEDMPSNYLGLSNSLNVPLLSAVAQILPVSEPLSITSTSNTYKYTFSGTSFSQCIPEPIPVQPLYSFPTMSSVQRLSTANDNVKVCSSGGTHTTRWNAHISVVPRNTPQDSSLTERIVPPINPTQIRIKKSSQNVETTDCGVTPEFSKHYNTSFGHARNDSVKTNINRTQRTRRHSIPGYAGER